MSLFFSGREMARKLSPGEAIRTAIGVEKDSILFYLEMKGLVRKEDQPAVDRIIKEEKQHLRQLSSLLSEVEK